MTLKSRGRVGAATLAVSALGLFVLIRESRPRSALADTPPVPRDFYGEADPDVTAGVTPVPDGMNCGGLSVAPLPLGAPGMEPLLTVQTSEPPGGFTGACLMNRLYGTGLLPSVCYSPSPATYTIRDHGPTVECKVPAANVAQPDWKLSIQGQEVTRQLVARLRTLETCVPHLGFVDPNCQAQPTQAGKGFYAGANGDYPNGDCPCGTVLVSHSCCTQIGAAMTSDDGQTARGVAYFTVP